MIFLPFREFLVRFFLKSGWKDGIRGFVLCILYSTFQFVLHANLWYLQKVDIKKITN